MKLEFCFAERHTPFSPMVSSFSLVISTHRSETSPLCVPARPAEPADTGYEVPLGLLLDLLGFLVGAV